MRMPRFDLSSKPALHHGMISTHPSKSVVKTRSFEAPPAKDPPENVNLIMFFGMCTSRQIDCAPQRPHQRPGSCSSYPAPAPAP